MDGFNILKSIFINSALDLISKMSQKSNLNKLFFDCSIYQDVSRFVRNLISTFFKFGRADSTPL